MSITLIVAMDMGNGIGDKEGNLLYDLPKDRKFFRKQTLGKTCVFGRTTYEGLPKPLKDRDNYVLTSNKEAEYEEAKVVNSIEEVLDLAKNEEVMICGGGEVYKQFLPYADKMIITHIHDVSIKARAFFPDFKWSDWTPEIISKHKPDKKHKQSFTIAQYIKKD